MNPAEHYRYQVQLSPDDGEYVGTVAELPSLSWLSADPVEAFVGIRRVAVAAVAEMQDNAEIVPAPFTA